MTTKSPTDTNKTEKKRTRPKRIPQLDPSSRTQLLKRFHSLLEKPNIPRIPPPIHDTVSTPTKFIPSKIDLTGDAESFIDDLNVPHERSRVIIEDLKTHDIFVSPSKALTPTTKIKNRFSLEFEELSALLNKTIKVESPELIKKLFEQSSLETPKFVPKYDFHLLIESQGFYDYQCSGTNIEWTRKG